MFPSSVFKKDILKYAGINFDTGDVTIRNNLIVVSNTSYIGNYTGLPAVSRSDVNGNLIGNHIEVTGNVTCNYLFGDGSALRGVTNGPLPPTINTDVLGNISGNYLTVTGTVSSEGFFIGNGSLISNIVTTLPRQANADILRGNVLAFGNVDASNVTTQLLRAYANTLVTGQVNVVGNVVSLYLVGNGSTLEGVQGSLPLRANINITGNVTAPGNVIAANITANTMSIAGLTTVQGRVIAIGNVTSSSFVGDGSTLTGVFGDTLARNVIGNVTASGNISAGTFVGNGYFLSLPGSTLQPRGTVPDEAARLALAAGIGTIVTQEDNSQQYMLTSLPPSLNANWLVFSGSNFPVQSLFGRTGAVVIISGTDIQDIQGQSLAGVGDVTVANIDIRGNVSSPANITMASSNIVSLSTGNVYVTGQVQVSGNVAGAYLFGNAAGITNASFLLPSHANINIRGNVVSPANIDTANLVVGALRVNGNAIFEGNGNVFGNVFATYFIGNGSTLTTPNSTITRGQVVNIVGNVVAPANVDAINITTPILRTEDILGFQTFQVTGNVHASLFFGNGALLTNAVANLSQGQTMNVIGNVSSSGNVDAVNVITNSLSVFAVGNLIAGGQVNVSGNIYANSFIGNGFFLTNVPYTVTGGQVMNIFGNVRAAANVDSANLVANSLLVTGNANVLGQITSVGNVYNRAGTFVGNGAFITGLRPSGNLNVNIPVNVTSPGNVDAANIVVANNLTVNGNSIVGGQVNIVGNMIATNFYGDGSGITNIGSCTAPASTCFVFPSSGFTSNSNSYDYAPTTGWTFTLTPNVTTTVGIQTFSLPLDPGLPFSGLPSNVVTQNVTTPWVNSNGTWTANVALRPNAEFALRNVSMGLSSLYGTYLGNSCNTMMSSLSVQNALGTMSTATANLFAVNMLASYISPTTGRVSLCFNGKGGSFIGTTWVANALYYAVTDKNFTSVITSNEITSSTTRFVNQPNKISGYFANETILYVGVPTAGTGVANVPAFYGDPIQVINANVVSFVTAKLDAGAQSLAWATSLSGNTSFRNTFLQISLSPDTNKLLLTGQLDLGANVIGIRTQTTGNVVTFTDNRLLTPNGATFYHGIAAVLNTTTGTEINRTMQDMVSNTVPAAGPPPLDLRSYPNAWSDDSNTAYFTLGSLESNLRPYVWKTYAGSNTWTQRAFLPTGDLAPFNNTLFWMMRVPTDAPNTGAWVANTFAMANVTEPGYVLRPGSITSSGDGNLWVATSIFRNGGYSGNNIFTFAGNSITTPNINTTSLSFIGIWKVQDSNGSYTSLTLLSNSSETANTGKFTACAAAQTISAGRYTPKGKGVIRFHTISNISNIVLNGVFCRGLTNPTSARLTSFDIHPNLMVSGFNATSDVFLANSISGTDLCVGNAADYNYSLNLNIANVAKLNIDGIV